MNAATMDTLTRARGVEDACGGTVDEHRVLYFGDHDPDGWQIPRSAHETLRGIRRVMDDPPRRPIVFERIALNMSQITVHRPPPFPAKVTSSRYRGYVDEHGTADAWELDALDPPVLAGLITSSVMRHWDPDIHGHNCEIVAARREQLRRDMRSNPETLMERL